MTEEIKLHTGRIVEQYAVLVKDEHDVITNLSHYQGSQGLEVTEVDKNFLAEELLRSYYKGSILKYLLHEREKNGIEDLKKARKHLDWLIELEENCDTH